MTLDVHITRSGLRRAVRRLVPGCLDPRSHASFVVHYAWPDLECRHRVKGRNGGVRKGASVPFSDPQPDCYSASTRVAPVTPDNPAIPVVRGGYPHSQDCPDDWAFVGQTGGTTRVR